VRRRRPGRGDDRRAPQLSRTTAELKVRLQPRARRDEIAGERDGRILVRVTAPPVEDRANGALRRLIAKRVGVAKSCVKIVRGQRSRDKSLVVEGIDGEAARRRLLSG
jgi:uncharacterized protein